MLEAEIGTMEKQDFASRERKVKVRTLLNHSNPSLDYDLFRPHIVLANPRLAARRSHPGGEDSYGCRFARAVWSQQTENLSGRDLKREAVESNDLRFGLFVPLAARWAETEAAAGGKRRR